ncbi:pyruvate formate lyase-activating protein [Glaesserella parasuis]|uniref:pyruvate formate lyase-activating protein n=1 Tax=Glaesserella parasuis TaxID=738 RepID=UPI00094F5145|nr:pyruvate formate lyase-activating protein [Glaesserella parasuis]MDG6281920.1 pyruvate formate lyase-activating protein [Glaesserella parasuis]MDG6283489.1 pyruvate formate lyase-activating protein [Glaesserella parasuis]MDG6311106.1 pyruvate formate lyase-activating protein [Glaesserella parasuis]MDG6326094.1 pyruvate formate lyase-activating protein [Glaesserella parasuis]MDG6330313.1 pyruvate formate lyase-activating protein [Glaesserella parasuis]
MYRLTFFLISTLLFNSSLSAKWLKINDVDYIWGPFKIYNISLFSETGSYTNSTRPLMLTLKYQKPVEGRDFAISLARSWSNLGITLQNQDNVVDRLRKILPNIKKDDSLSYIALEDKGYFILNNIVIPEEFNKEFNDAVVAIWLDPRVEIGRKLVNKEEKIFIANIPRVLETQKPQNIENNIGVHEESIDPVVDSSKVSNDIKQNLDSSIMPRVQDKPLTQSNEENMKEAEKPLEDSEIDISPPLDPIPEGKYLNI